VTASDACTDHGETPRTWCHFGAVAVTRVCSTLTKHDSCRNLLACKMPYSIRCFDLRWPLLTVFLKPLLALGVPCSIQFELRARTSLLLFYGLTRGYR
jgi:hypothetical protein